VVGVSDMTYLKALFPAIRAAVSPCRLACEIKSNLLHHIASFPPKPESSFPWPSGPWCSPG